MFGGEPSEGLGGDGGIVSLAIDRRRLAPPQQGIAAEGNDQAHGQSLANTCSRPSTASTSDMPGEAVLPVSAARRGWATLPSLRS